MTKKRSWDSKDPIQKAKCNKSCKEMCDEKECTKKVSVSKESLEDWRITRNELIMEVAERDNIIDDLYENVIDLSLALDNAKFIRNLSLIINVGLIVLLFLVA